MALRDRLRTHFRLPSQREAMLTMFDAFTAAELAMMQRREDGDV
jgi:hypothetical protein